MRHYLHSHIWKEIAPEADQTLWVAQKVLRLPFEQANESGIYGALASFYRLGKKELDRYNSSRSDLIAYMIDPPADDPELISIPLEPSSDPSLWLCSHLLGLSDTETSLLATGSQLTPAELVEMQPRVLVPILVNAQKILKGLKFKEELLTIYHRERYLLLRYYLDAVYHEI